jgi:tetratricopeptide (TPR) repeat protein
LQGADALYGRTFRDAGLDVEGLPAEEAGQRVAASTVAAELAGVLDSWASTRRENRGPDDPSWKHLVQVARVADPDAWRTRVRDALVRTDRQALLSLASSEEVFGLAPATLFVLGHALRMGTESSARNPGPTGGDAQVEVFLRRAQRRHPNDFWLNENLVSFFHAMQPPRAEEEVRFAAVAMALRPGSPGARNNLALALAGKGQFDEAIAEYREALRLKKDYPEAHNNLGLALKAKGLLDEAIAEYREALHSKKDFALIHTNLGNALHVKGLLDEAIAEHREALRLKKDDATAHNNLGTTLRDKGQLDDAIAEYRAALRINKDLHQTHNNLGVALHGKGLVDEAIAAYREAIRLKKDDAAAHNNLACALADKGQLDKAIAEWHEALRIKKDYVDPHLNLGKALHGDEAIAAYREAVRINKDCAEAHFNLGILLRNMGRLDEAIAEYREVIRIKKDYAEAHCNLGLVLRQKGEFQKSVEELRRGHELGSRNPRWPYSSAQWVREAQQLAQLDDRLPAVLEGKDQPRDAAERLGFAELCPYRKQYAAAVRFYEKAFTDEPKLAQDLRAGHRYNAACAAALAGCGQGNDVDKLNTKERARLREQALEWLRADLDAWGRLLNKEPDMVRPVVVQQMRHWLADTDFVGVRGPQALAKLPEAERQPWQKLWHDVANTLARAQAKKPEKKSGAK